MVSKFLKKQLRERGMSKDDMNNPRSFQENYQAMDKDDKLAWEEAIRTGKVPEYHKKRGHYFG